MKRITAVLSDGTIATRKTDRVYTHVLEVECKDEPNFVLAWCGRYDLAVKQMNSRYNRWAIESGHTLRVTEIKPAEGYKKPSPKKTKLTATFTDGSKATRTTHVPYTHVVRVTTTNGKTTYYWERSLPAARARVNVRQYEKDSTCTFYDYMNNALIELAEVK